MRIYARLKHPAAKVISGNKPFIFLGKVIIITANDNWLSILSKTMTPHDITPGFLRELDSLDGSSQEFSQAEIQDLITQIANNHQTGIPGLDAARRELVQYAAHKLGVNPTLPLPDPHLNLPLGPLRQISPAGIPGISLVTCCMNRSANLLKALDSWLACPELREIIIVDWSSTEPVLATLQAKGVLDPRIQVIRVEGETRWVLSYAFNVGFRAATSSRILKADADIIVTPGFFQKNKLHKDHFIAGNWRKASTDQVYVNGFFYTHKSDLAAIAGFNEYITTYGWDDDDIYNRLTLAGVTRQDVDASTIHHQEHSDETRTGENASQGVQTALEELHSTTLYKIRRNRFLANVMPKWDPNQHMLPFSIIGTHANGATVRRKGREPQPVQESIQKDATFYATLEMAAWRLGQRVLALSRIQLTTLLTNPFAELSPLNVELALSNQFKTCLAKGGYLIISLKDTPEDSSSTDRALAKLVTQAQVQGLTPILTGPFQTLSGSASTTARACAFIPDYENIGETSSIIAADLTGPLQRAPGQHFKMALDATTSAVLPLAAPAVQQNRSRIFVDGQHGLGNRLRAIGSAAAISEKSGHEMVIVWHPDDHCDCRFSDLFDYDGAVIEESFIDTAASQDCRVYNYMEVEAGGEKDALIDLQGDANIYARSAYVLNSPLRNWDDENRFLRALRPVQAVRDMMATVRTPNDVSAHVRMVGGKNYEHLSFEATDNWTEEGHKLTEFWRKKSHFKHFINRLDTLISEGSADRIFLAADKPETYAEFKACFGDRVAVLERQVYDRSAEQLRYALADALLLANSPLLLGSSWSSFSELAMRLSPQKMELEMSGKDF